MKLKVYMYLPKGTTIEAQSKEFHGNAIYYTLNGVVKAVNQQNQQADNIIEQIKDGLGAFTPIAKNGVGDAKKAALKKVKLLNKELKLVKKHNIDDYVQVELDFSAMGRLEKMTKKQKKELN